MKIFLFLFGLLVLAGIFYRRHEILQKGSSTLPFFGKRKRNFHLSHTHEHSSEITAQEMIPDPETVDSRDALKASTLLKKADAALAKGDLKMAEKLAIQSIALNPSFREAYSKLGLLYLAQEQFPRAEMIFRRLILGENREAAPFSNLGLSLYQQNKLAEARVFYEKAIELDASRPGRFFSLAKILHEMQELDLALQYFKKAAEMDPRNLDYLLTLAEFYREREMKAEFQHLVLELKRVFPEEERVRLLDNSPQI